MSKTILVVDDDPVIRMLVTQYLASFGYNIQAASGGNECLQMLASSTPDIVILDMIMPDMTGVDVLKNIRADQNIASIPVILLSANSDTQQIVGKENISADRYLMKPFQMNAILDAVKSL